MRPLTIVTHITPPSSAVTTPLSSPSAVMVDYFSDKTAIMCLRNMGGATAPRLTIMKKIKPTYPAIEDIF